MRLWTVQHRAVLALLQDGGELVGDWARLMTHSFRPAYEEMAAELARRGLDCAGRPPVWAWFGPDTRDGRVALTAELLLSPQTPDEYEQYVVLDLDVPDAFVVLSSYRRWNDFMEAVFTGADAPAMDWSVDRDEFDDSAGVRVQACLPRIDASWVLGVRPLEPWSPDEPDETPVQISE